MRCLTLATALRERGAEVTFISRMHEAHLGGVDRGAGLWLVPPAAASRNRGPGLAYRRVARCPMGRRAEDTIDVLRRSGTSHGWWSTTTRSIIGGRSACDRSRSDSSSSTTWQTAHTTATSCSTRIWSRAGNPVRRLASRWCAPMLGPTYAMLQPDFREMRPDVRARSGSIRSILISFGGSDADNLTGRAVAAFLGLHRADVNVDVVVGTANPWGPSLREQSAGCSNVTIHTALPTLAPLMSKADLAIGAAGSTTWERLCRVARPGRDAGRQPATHRGGDQRSPPRALAGGCEHSDRGRFRRSDARASRARPRSHWSRRCLAVVDGRGVDRVAAALLLTRETALRVRPVTESDEALLLEWANDRLTRQNAFSSAPISASEHRKWFRRRLGDSAGCRSISRRRRTVSR